MAMTEAAEGTLFLEVENHGESFSMGLFGQDESASTLRHYNQHKISFVELDILCREISFLVNKINKNKNPEQTLVKGLKKNGQMLWDFLLSRPIKDKLCQRHSQNLVLLIDESLVHVPWELLYDGSNFLCVNYNLGRSIRTRQQQYPLATRSFGDIIRMLVLSDPTGDLKSSYSEGIQIRNQFDIKRARIHIDVKSSAVSRLYVKKNMCDYDIVHFAGHCEYDHNRPEHTGWVLEDGRFTSGDIHTLGQSMPLPSLVFSNACYSAKVSPESGDLEFKERNFSLASAFLFSGVRHYIGSIRRLDDESSLLFAREFYHQIISGKSIGEGVRLARLRLIRELGISNISWASYVLYGDPNFILFKPRSRQSPQRVSKKIFSRKKLIASAAGLIAVTGCAALLYLGLRSFNPGSYYFYQRAKHEYSQGMNLAALGSLNKAVALDPLNTKAYSLLADVSLRLGKKEKALAYYYQYALLSEKKNDLSSLAAAYTALGWFYYTQGTPKKSLDFYEKAVDLSRKRGDKLQEAVALRKMAVWRMDNKEYDAALALLTKSSEINREREGVFEHRYNLACDYFDLGLLFADKDDFDAARQFYQKSLVLFKKFRLKSELSDYYFNMGEIYLFEKQFQKALSCYQEGLRIDHLQNNKLSLASDYNMLGELYMQMDNLGEAEKAFAASVAVAGEIQAQLELADASRNLGLLYKQKGEKPRAREYLRKAQEIYGQLENPAYEEIKSDFSGLD